MADTRSNWPANTRSDWPAAFTPTRYDDPGAFIRPYLPTTPPVLTEADIARIVRAVFAALDERETPPSPLDVTPADLRRYLGGDHG